MTKYINIYSVNNSVTQGEPRENAHYICSGFIVIIIIKEELLLICILKSHILNIVLLFSITEELRFEGDISINSAAVCHPFSAFIWDEQMLETPPSTPKM